MMMKDCTMSMDLEASVYTQNSISSVAPLSLGVFVQFGAVGSVFVYPASSKSTSMSYTPVPGVVRKGTPDVGLVSPAPLPSPITPNFTSAIWMKIEGGVVSEGGNPDIEDGEKNLGATQDSSGLGNRIVVEDKDKLPSRIFNGSFNDVHSSSSESTPEASRSSPPSVPMHLRHVDRHISPLPSPEPVL